MFTHIYPPSVDSEECMFCNLRHYRVDATLARRESYGTWYCNKCNILPRPNMIKRNAISVVTGMVVEKIARSVKYIVRNVEDQLMYEKMTCKPAFV